MSDYTNDELSGMVDDLKAELADVLPRHNQFRSALEEIIRNVKAYKTADNMAGRLYEIAADALEVSECSEGPTPGQCDEILGKKHYGHRGY